LEFDGLISNVEIASIVGAVSSPYRDVEEDEGGNDDDVLS